MSYINDALLKVQKEKESPYDSYEHILSTEDIKPVTRRKWILAAGFIAIFFLAAGLVALLYWPDVRKTQRTVPLASRPGITATQPGQSMDALKTRVPRPDALAELAVPLSVDKKQAAEVRDTRQATLMDDSPLKQEAPVQPALTDRGSIYHQALQMQHQGRLEEAKALYKKVIKKEPHHIQALNNLGVVYMNLKAYPWAIIRFNDALRIKHNYVDAHYNLACLYARKNDTQQSLFYLKNAIKFNPEARQWAVRDDDLKNIADLPEFNKIMQTRD